MIEVPAGPTAGLVIDFWQHPVTDLGPAGPDQGKGGTMVLLLNDKKVGEGRLEKTAWSRFTAEDFDIGADTGSPVSADYASPNPYTGWLKKVEIVTQPPNLSAADREILRSLERRARLSTE